MRILSILLFCLAAVASASAQNLEADLAKIQQLETTKIESELGLLAGKYYRGRCFSRDSGTDLGFVYGSSTGELTNECRRYAVNPIVANITEIPCPPDGSHVGCEEGIDAQPVCSPGSPGQNSQTGARIAGVLPFQTRRACVTVPGNMPVRKVSCRIEGAGRDEYCRFSHGTDGCSWAASRRFTVAQVGDKKTYCWTVWNESHNSERAITLSVE